MTNVASLKRQSPLSSAKSLPITVDRMINSVAPEYEYRKVVHYLAPATLKLCKRLKLDDILAYILSRFYNSLIKDPVKLEALTSISLVRYHQLLSGKRSHWSEDSSNSHFVSSKRYYCGNRDLLAKLKHVILCPLLDQDRLTAILIRGPVGCGKTATVQYAAKRLNLKLVKIQLSGQTDLYNLIGTYHFIGNQFEWVPGPFTRACLNPNTILLLEDIDQCPEDVASFLVDVVENRSLRIRGERNIVHKSVRIVLTERTGGFSGKCSDCSHLIRESADPVAICKHIFRHCPCQVIQRVCSHLSESEPELTIRNAIRCLRRQLPFIRQSHEDQLVKYDAFPDLEMDIADCFRLSEKSKRRRILGIDAVIEEARKTRFALTENTSSLLATIYRSAVQSEEATLLVGPTGVGKTSCVQLLAKAMNKKLIVVNLNQQSDALSDLIGSYKPLDISKEIELILRRLSVLLNNVFPTHFAEKMVDMVRIEADKEKFSLALNLMENAGNKIMDKHEDDGRKILAEIQDLKGNLKPGLHFTFKFVNGPLVRALKDGHWLLLDEVNLASDETLAVLDELLDSGTIVVYENGQGKPIKKSSPGFRLFACMNPPDSSGAKKRILPRSIRSRFTEITVEECIDDLKSIITVGLDGKKYPAGVVDGFFQFYTTVKPVLDVNIRTLCRTIRYFREMKTAYVLRGLYDGLLMCFGSHCRTSNDHAILASFVANFLNEIESNALEKIKASQYFKFEQSDIKICDYWLRKGKCTNSHEIKYVFTDGVKKNLSALARAVSFGKYPILLQGETSVGKTSLVQWLANHTNNHLIRINNHEHTDLAEYIGTYCGSNQGLKFQYGPLVKAMIQGHWVLIDELNLAPSDVLEALNRVLDDNNELFIAETGETIKPNKGFLIFATQNPAGFHYQGRKRLSKAFRSRFIEIQFDRYNKCDLERILCEKTEIPSSCASKMIEVFTRLESARSSSFIFAGRSGLVTLRDLFRWARRFTKSKCDHKDYIQYVVDMGYLLLSGRVRCSRDVLMIKEAIEEVFKRHIHEESLFDFSSPSTNGFKAVLEIPPEFGHLVLTKSLRRMLLMSSICHNFDEPFLLVGKTGIGKTTVCQLLARMFSQKLFTINCHGQIEAGDFLGGWHTSSSSLIDWKDGQLINAMNEGEIFLLDEIALADDSVLERLNSLLDNDRSIFIPDHPSTQNVTAHAQFRLVATMNPSGDYGKRELSTALRNRFTEIYCDLDEQSLIDDLCDVIDRNFSLDDCEFSKLAMIDFVRRVIPINDQFTVRDVLAWVGFVNDTKNVYEGALAVFGDCFDSIPKNVQVAFEELRNKVGEWEASFSMVDLPTHFRRTPTVDLIISKINRAMKIQRPILLEGVPGIGKTYLPRIIAQANHAKIIRLNLSEQTDICDLFGVEVPDGKSGFHWRDGALLKAIRTSSWLILDELNLANQNILEALNGCFDHRHELYVPGIEERFFIDFRKIKIFATQNPHEHGHGRKGLPRSFLNRFSKIQVPSLTREDISLIADLDYVPSKVLNVRDALRFRQLSKIVVEAEAEEIFNGHDECEQRRFWFGTNRVKFGRNCILKRQQSDISMDLYLYPSMIPILRSLVYCVQCKWPVLLTGKTNCGKLCAIKSLAAIYGELANLKVVSLSPSSDSFDLLGTYEQTISSQNERPAFEWVKSALVEAIEQGHWLVLRNANRCPTAVLDRLNPLLEVDQNEFWISEAGISVSQHPNLRIFLTMDPKYGNVSAALKNRTMEIQMIHNEVDIDRVRECRYLSLETNTKPKSSMSTVNLRLLLSDQLLAKLRPVWFVFNASEKTISDVFKCYLAIERCSPEMLSILSKSDNHLLVKSTNRILKSMDLSSFKQDEPIIKSVYPDLFEPVNELDCEMVAQIWISVFISRLNANNSLEHKFVDFLNGSINCKSLKNAILFSLISSAIVFDWKSLQCDKQTDELLKRVVFFDITSTELDHDDGTMEYWQFVRLLHELNSNERIKSLPESSFVQHLAKVIPLLANRNLESLKIADFTFNERLLILRGFIRSKRDVLSLNETSMAYRLNNAFNRISFVDNENDFVSRSRELFYDCSIAQYGLMRETFDAVKNDLIVLTGTRYDCDPDDPWHFKVDEDAIEFYRRLSEPRITIDPACAEYMTCVIRNVLITYLHIFCELVSKISIHEIGIVIPYAFELEIKSVLPKTIRPVSSTVPEDLSKRQFIDLIKFLNDFNQRIICNRTIDRRTMILIFMDELESKFSDGRLSDIIRPIMFSLANVCFKLESESKSNGFIDTCSHQWPLRSPERVEIIANNGINEFKTSGDLKLFLVLVKLFKCTRKDRFVSNTHRRLIDCLLNWWERWCGMTLDEAVRRNAVEMDEEINLDEHSDIPEVKEVAFNEQCIYELYESISFAPKNMNSNDEYQKFVDALCQSSAKYRQSSLFNHPSIVNFSLDLENLRLLESIKTKTLNFYTDPNPEEAFLCVPLVEKIHKYVLPSREMDVANPFMEDVRSICERVLNLNVQRPLSDFLIGLDLLCSKIESFTSNKSNEDRLDKRNVNKIYELIAKWRKLELQSWPAALDRVSRQLRRFEPIQRFWLPIYSLLNAHQDESPSLFETIRQFVCGSTVGDFHTRCEIIEICYRLSGHRSSILINTVRKWASYELSVQHFINEHTTELEKRLDGAVKTCSWAKISNYHALRSWSHKTRSMVLHCVRRLKDMLNESVLTQIAKDVPQIDSTDYSDFNLEKIDELIDRSKHLSMERSATESKCVQLMVSVIDGLRRKDMIGLSGLIEMTTNNIDSKEKVIDDILSEARSVFAAKTTRYNLVDIAEVGRAFIDQLLPLDRLFWCLYVRHEHFLSVKPTLVKRKDRLKRMVNLAIDCVLECIDQRRRLLTWSRIIEHCSFSKDDQISNSNKSSPLWQTISEHELKIMIQVLVKWISENVTLPRLPDSKREGSIKEDIQSFIKECLKQCVLPLMYSLHRRTILCSIHLIDLFREVTKSVEEERMMDVACGDDKNPQGMSSCEKIEGGEDVSKEIEYEDQIEGLRGDEEARNEGMDEAEGCEMNDDFGDGDENEGELEEGVNEELDDEFGENLDGAGDDGVLDERLWDMQDESNDDKDQGEGDIMDVDQGEPDFEQEALAEDNAADDTEFMGEGNDDQIVNEEDDLMGENEADDGTDEMDVCKPKDDESDVDTDLMLDGSDEGLDGKGQGDGGEEGEVTDEVVNGAEGDLGEVNDKFEYGNKEEDFVGDGLGDTGQSNEEPDFKQDDDGRQEMGEEREKKKVNYADIVNIKAENDEIAITDDTSSNVSWSLAVDSIKVLCSELSEKLRVVLEPTKAARLQGDFRTGRRLNMRRVLAYVATNFKQDRIWLRRVRPDIRDVRVLLAVDNSKSMERVRTIVPQSVALVSQSLELLQGAKVAFMTFGDQVQCVHGFADGPVNAATGQLMMDLLTFRDRKSGFVEMLQEARNMFNADPQQTFSVGQRLLVVISDGLVLDNPNEVKRTIATIMNNSDDGIFVLLIMMDCHEDRKYSLLTMKHAHFIDGKVEFKSVMDDFPFPYYIAVRDVNEIAEMLACSLYQWFEMLVSNCRAV
ncbi:hypothetical protein ACOME3_006815 [Neoechinorhynchus agilis]